MSIDTLAVLGATGTTGAELVKQASAAGLAVRALSRNPAAVPSLTGVTAAQADLDDRDSLVAAFRGADALYLNIIPGPGALAQVDNALAASAEAGVKLVIKLSGLHAVPTSPSAIIRLHAEADERVRASGIDYAILRANSFFQNIEAQLAGIRDDGVFYLAMGDARQSLIDVADIAAVAVRILQVPALRNRDYDLTGSESLTCHDVAEALSAAAGKPVRYIPITNEAFRQSLTDNGVPEAAASNVAELFAQFAAGTYAEPTGDVAAVLDRAPSAYADYASRFLGGAMA